MAGYERLIGMVPLIGPVLGPNRWLRLGLFCLPEHNKPNKKTTHAFVRIGLLNRKGRKTTSEVKTEEKGKGSLIVFFKALQKNIQSNPEHYQTRNISAFAC